MKIYIKSAVFPISKEDYSLRREIALDPNTDSNTLIALADVSNDKLNGRYLLNSICNNPNATMDTLLAIREKYPSNSDIVDSYIARRTSNPDLLDELADTEGNLGLIYCILINPNTSTNTLLKLYYKYRKQITDIALKLAKRYGISTEVIDDLIEDSICGRCEDTYYVLLNVIVKPNITQEQIRKIFEFALEKALEKPGSYYDICLFLAKSDTTPPDILERLSNEHPDENIRYYALANPNHPRH